MAGDENLPLLSGGFSPLEGEASCVADAHRFNAICEDTKHVLCIFRLDTWRHSAKGRADKKYTAHRKFNGLGCYRVAEKKTMIRCVRIWTGHDGNSLFEDGTINLSTGALPTDERGDLLSDKAAVASISFRETRSGGAFAPHDAPTRQLVITLAGTLEFKTARQETFIIHPGDILLAEDTAGSGHSWRLVDDNPWRRAYVILAPNATVPFRKTNH